VGIGVLPSESFQNSEPSGSARKAAEVWSAGCGVSEAAAGPSPLPFSPWQGEQLVM